MHVLVHNKFVWCTHSLALSRTLTLSLVLSPSRVHVSVLLFISSTLYFIAIKERLLCSCSVRRVYVFWPLPMPVPVHIVAHLCGVICQRNMSLFVRWRYTHLACLIVRLSHQPHVCDIYIRNRTYIILNAAYASAKCANTGLAICTYVDR